MTSTTGTVRRDRRRLLARLAATPAAMAGLSLPLWAGQAAAQAGLITGSVCQVMPEVTEGPYYLDPTEIRADIREDRDGLPMDMLLQVVDAACAPIAGARVDLWHCDAAGTYSGFRNDGGGGDVDARDRIFLRGTQMAGEDGVARFRTIFPGWYRGRVTHMHFKVWLDRRSVLTGQVFFADAISSAVYARDTRYARADTDGYLTNAEDRIARAAGEGAHAAVEDAGDSMTARLVIGLAA